jgi:hypothetical protein
MKKFITKIITTSVPLLLILVSVNYIGDAAKIFDSEYEKQITEIISEGKYVTNISNYDERVLQKELVSKLNDIPQILVFGSSRTMLINSEHFPKQSLFNNSVSGASLEDLIALYQIYKDHNLTPKKIILGIDPWLLNENNGQSRWKSIEYFYNRYYQEDESKPTSNFMHKYGQLYSLSYFQASIKAIPKLFSGSSKPLETLTKQNKSNTKLIDGSLVYGESYRNATQEDINTKIRDYINGKIYSIEDFESISNTIWSDFQNFIKDLKDENISIEFFLCPYAPVVFDEVTKHYSNVMKTQDLILNFAKENKIKVYGSFSPYDLDFDETYFYDGMHCTEKGIENILRTK